MGRSPCCEKVGLKKGPWTPEEDNKLLAYIEEHGHGSWRALPAKAGLQRCGKSCRLRWTNYLRPDIKRGKFSIQEEQTIIQLHALLGNRWSAIATHLPKRTDNEIKNHWNTHLKKRLTKMGIDPVTHKPKSDALGPGQMKDAANLSHMAQWESARLEAEARLVRESKLQVSTNPFQPVLGSSSTSAQLLNKPASASASAPQPPPPPPFTQLPPPLCLDVLTAWQGAWIRAPKDNSISSCIFAAAGNLESPTSPFNFGKTAFPISNCTGLFPNEYVNVNVAGAGNVGCEAMAAMKVEAHELGKPNHFSELKEIMDNAIQFQEIVYSGSGDDLYNVAAEKTANANMLLPNFMEGLTDLLLENSHDLYQPNAGGNSGNVAGTCCGDFEENKNYWNTIMNLVNCSPSGSPVF